MKKRALVVAVIAAVGAACINCVVSVIFGARHSIATVNAADSYSIRIWSEYPSLRDWDPDISDPTVLYEVTQSGRVVVPQTWLTLEIEKTHRIKIAFAEEKHLVCVYDAESAEWEPLDMRLFVILDTTSGAIWPRDASVESADLRRWSEISDRLRRENPDLPDYFAWVDK